MHYCIFTANPSPLLVSLLKVNAKTASLREHNMILIAMIAKQFINLLAIVL